MKVGLTLEADLEERRMKGTSLSSEEKNGEKEIYRTSDKFMILSNV
jgi:hypothetical protein